MTADARFQVNLQGLIELLSEHLYSGPQVYVRELLQNGVDAVAMRGLGPDSSDEVRPGVVLEVGDAVLACRDSGVGLSAADVESFLATVGRSAKRDQLGLARTDLIGQFGIGALSGFLVSDEIEVISRQQDPETVTWRADGAGTYRTDRYADPGDVPGLDHADRDWLTAGPGTVVRLRARPGDERWFEPETVTMLARQYAGLVEGDIRVVTARGSERITEPPPWRRSAAERLAWAEREFGIRVLTTVPVEVPGAQLEGMAIISGEPVSAGQGSRHRVHVKGMRVLEGSVPLLPSWGFFAHLVVDAGLLRPTASREQIREDEVLFLARDELGNRLRRWLVDAARSQPEVFDLFLGLHALALKAMLADSDRDDFLELMQVLPFLTTLGPTTLTELLDSHDRVLVVTSVDDYRQIAAIATAQGTALVNAGHVHEDTLVRRFAQESPDGGRLVEVDPTSFTGHTEPLSGERAHRIAPLVATAQSVLDHTGVRVEAGRFQPDTLPALLLDSLDAQRRRMSRQLQETGDIWSGVLRSLDDDVDARPLFVLNDANPVVGRLAEVEGPALHPAIQALYARALLQGQRPVTAADSRLIDRAFASLIDLAVGEQS
ncbi:HSP90 family protein [Parenemella sanctibonifatiensis]|uniref:HSP90 family protein n=1 Tax=Parenemella sanctibonifatiensis TaxID=2016505 RepID=A0A255E8Z0_9ACTN|nr:HSP90 family protein [Parenemella sanctibonifatiensis]OYN84593.1 HSP90 family protein [Parenemella sanctibonifatiensis]